MTPESNICMWTTCREESNIPCLSNLDMAVLCPVDTQGWICTVIARKAHHTHMSKQTWYPEQENQGFHSFFSSLSKSEESSKFNNTSKMSGEKNLTLEGLEQPRGSSIGSGFTLEPLETLRVQAHVPCFKKKRKTNPKPKIQTQAQSTDTRRWLSTL